MNIKKINKVISVIMLAIMITLIISSVVFAENTSGAIDPKDIKGQAAETGQIQKIGGQIVTIVSVIGSIAAVIVLVVLGLKYMMGSAEEKAEYKKTLMPYVIGATLVFAASAIAGMVYQFSSGISGN